MPRWASGQKTRTTLRVSRMNNADLYTDSLKLGVLTGIIFLFIKFVFEAITVMTSPLADWSYVVVEPDLLGFMFLTIGGSATAAFLLIYGNRQGDSASKPEGENAE